MAPLLPISPLFISLLLMTVWASVGRSWHVIPLMSLLPTDSCSSLQGNQHIKSLDSTRLKIVHRDGPCSPPDLRRSPSHQQILTHDQRRVDTIHRRRTSTQHRGPDTEDGGGLLAASAIPARSGSSLGTGNYIVTIGVGTPAKEFSVVFDTGSDVTWIQCRPCVAYCYPQHDPLFDPVQSSTYTNISCSSAACGDLYLHSCSSSSCLYAVEYGDSSYTVGFYAEDTLTLSPSDVIPGFQFGCGEKNRGLFGKAAGLLGLGRDKASLVSQTLGRYGGVFAYCLPPTPSTTGYLSFGAGSPASDAVYTTLLTDPSMPTFYYLNLTAISISGKLLSIPPSVFSTAGTIIDSGTVISRLPPGAYSALRDEFRQLMSAYKTAPAMSILDTCYDLSGDGNVTVPDITLQFDGGVEVDVDASGILYVASVSQACLAFAGNSDAGSVGIIGNVQQRTFNVAYDVSRAVVGFAPGAC